MMNALKFNYFKSTAFFDAAKLTVAMQNFEESRHDRRFRQDLLTNRTESVRVLTMNGDFEMVFDEKNELFYGMEYIYNHVNSSAFTHNKLTDEIGELSTRYPDGGSDVHGLAIYTSLKLKIKERIFLSTGLRYSYQNLYSRFKDPGFSFSSINNTNSAFNGNLGLVLKPNQRWNISGVFSTGFRVPNVDDISKVFDSEPGNVIVPNPDLKPEYSYNTEFSISRYFNEKIELNGTFFYSFLRNAMVRGDFTIDGQDSILYDGELSKVQAIVNTGRANIYGFNASLQMELNLYWSASMFINYTEGRDQINNEHLRHTTPLFGKASVVYARNNLKGELFVRFNGKRKFEDLPPSERNKTHLYTSEGSLAWFTLNLRAQYQLNNHLMFNAAVENILDHHYRTYSSGISAPGRNFVVSLRAKF